MKIVNVIPLKKGVLKNDLTYFTTKNVEVGDMVAVNLRSKKTLAIAVSIEEVSDTKMNIKGMDFNLKKIIEVKGKSVFSREYIDSVALASKYFASSKMNAFASLIPSIMIEEYDKLDSFPKQNSDNTTKARSEKLLLQESFENRISIYKTLIRENFALKKSVFIVLPTEHETEIFREQLSKGIEQFTFDIHSGITPKKTMEKLKDILSIEHPILILGTTPFLSIPRKDLGLIILENESSNSYKMIARPHFDLRIFAEIFASSINAKFILSDDLLRFETIARQELDGLLPMHPLSFRINFNKEIEIENPRQKNDSMSLTQSKMVIFKIFSENTKKEIKNTLLKQQNAFIFTLRKGLATSTVCMDCGSTVNCEKCQAPLVLYNSGGGKERMFACNRCGEEKDTEIKCRDCESWNLKPFGIGTETVFEELRTMFPKTKILKLDKESAKTKKGAESIVKEFEENTGSILVGTEMALFYLKNKVSLSVVTSFDSFWSIPNFRISEKMLQLVISIISKTDEKFIVQTKNDKDLAIRAIQSRNLLPFLRKELEDRKELAYPPFKRFIKIKFMGNKNETVKAKKFLEETFSDYNPLIFSGFISQLRGKYVTNALIKLDIKDWSFSRISMGSNINPNLYNQLISLSPNFEIFVDPEELF